MADWDTAGEILERMKWMVVADDEAEETISAEWKCDTRSHLLPSARAV